MKTKIKNIFTIVLSGILVFGGGLWFILKESEVYSESERRKLEELPKISAENVFSGKYMKDFENASPDQFPMRDTLRKIATLSRLSIFQKSDSNNIFYTDNHLSKLNYPLDENMLSHAAERFENIYTQYLENTDTKLYFSVVPDKNMFLAQENGYLSIDYNYMINNMKDKTAYMKYIDITDLLSADDYYRTDTHWKQECITDVADRLAESMNTELSRNYEKLTLDTPFYGVYHGQSALDTEADKLTYLTNEELSNAVVTIYPNGTAEKSVIYNTELAAGKDGYEMFLSGSQPLVEIENPLCKNEKELVIFRDSYASSLAPLLVSGYSKITLIDTRYMYPSVIPAFVEFKNQDVLFLYSSLILNSSLGIQ